MLGFDRKTPWSVFGPWRFMGISGIHRQSWVSWSSSRLSWYKTTYSITTLLLIGCQMEVHRYPFILLGGEGQRVEDPAWSRTQTSRLGVQRANLKATKSPQLNGSLECNLIWTKTMNIRKTLCRFTLRKPRQALMTRRAPFHKICKNNLMNTLSLVAHFVHMLHDSYFHDRVFSFLPDPNSSIRLWCSWRIHWQLLTPSRPKSPRSHQIRGNAIVSMASLIQ